MLKNNCDNVIRGVFGSKGFPKEGKTTLNRCLKRLITIEIWLRKTLELKSLFALGTPVLSYFITMTSFPKSVKLCCLIESIVWIYEKCNILI